LLSFMAAIESQSNVSRKGCRIASMTAGRFTAISS
jgi:hypothetical protein